MNRRILFAALVLLILASLLLPACSKAGYLKVIEANWDVSFPDDAEEILSVSTPAGFHGDGERYHVFRCGGFEGFEPLLSWDDFTLDGAYYPSTMWSELEVAEEDLPQQGAYKRCRCVQADGSAVLFLFSVDHSLLYVIESFQ